MGFEVLYRCHEKVDNEYNRDEVKTFKKKVGDPFEDVSLERLAGAIMAQLARRDILIVGLEAYELSKKEISCKETKGGIVLKNKKFLFDGDKVNSSAFIVEDLTESSPSTSSSTSPQQVSYSGNGPVRQPHELQPHNSAQQRRPIDWVVFAPELHQMSEVKQKNIRFTPDKKYPVFEKKPSPMGEIYSMVDDAGRDQLVSDKYFVPGNVELFGDRELGFTENQHSKDGGNLYWGGANIDPNMPDIRRK